MQGNPASIIRIRDPIHDLIRLDLENKQDALAWRLVDSREFQRLRRVKQLGFSELVFPGATHTRFSHCLGAYFIARRLLEIIRGKVPHFDESRATETAIAALLHDLGHGPYSHVFEGVQRDIGRKRSHEDWTADIIQGDSEVHTMLDSYSGDLASRIATILRRKDPSDIYDAVVSSQFDADRLDYLRRDRYMTGTQTGGFDFAWLLDCLETGKINIGAPGESAGDSYIEVDGLYLNHKGLAAAEGYLLARFHLYSQVYLHKTTRSAERMLAALLRRLCDLLKEDQGDQTALPKRHALVKFFEAEKPEVQSYLTLDDTVVWSGISEMAEAKDATIRTLATGLRDRKLYKCVDIGVRAKSGSDQLPHFKRLFSEKLKDQMGSLFLQDEAPLTAYGIHEYEDPGALQKILIGSADGSGKSEDIAERSALVKAIQKQRIFRVYYHEASAVEQINTLWQEAVK